MSPDALGAAEVEDLVNLVAVNRQRHRLAEAHILEDLLEHRIIVGLVEADADIVAATVVKEINLIVTGLFIFDVERVILDR
ncbi:MAG: hypothetical protein R2932_52385 [Caldilineaceae bacterium]